jgi:circadian clock protein KaiB
VKKRRKKFGTGGTRTETVVLLRLYIAGEAPNSVQAIANLQAICDEHLKDGCRVEIVDVLEQPGKAMAAGVLVTPSLTKLSPLPSAQVVGNLSDRAKVLAILGLDPSTGPSP